MSFGKSPLGFASLNITSHLSPYENKCTIALITIHHLYNITYGYFYKMDIYDVDANLDASDNATSGNEPSTEILISQSQKLE